jgi:uracil-DNA glycosylase
MAVQIEESWKKELEPEFEKQYFKNLVASLQSEKALGKEIFPIGSEIFNAFKFTPFDDVKVVILGQDPYHGPGQAHGLCFSVKKGVLVPPSLKNIYKELETDVNFITPSHGELSKWAQQGVFMLNASLTVVRSSPMSHSKIGWSTFTDAVIEILSQRKEKLVFLLWGKFAQSKIPLIDTTKHTVLTAAHPSPFSAYNGFFGCKHFSKTNESLRTFGLSPIDWQIN